MSNNQQYGNQGGGGFNPQQNQQFPNQGMNPGMQQGQPQGQQMGQQGMMNYQGYQNQRPMNPGQYPNQPPGGYPGNFAGNPQFQQRFPQQGYPNQGYPQQQQQPGAPMGQYNPQQPYSQMPGGMNPNMQHRMMNPNNSMNPNMINPNMPQRFGQPQMGPGMGQMPPGAQNFPPGGGQQQPTQQQAQQQQMCPEVSPQAPPRSRTIFDELLEGFEDVFARLIAKDEMLGAYDKDEISVGVEYSVNKFIKKAQVVELYFNQMIARRSGGNPQEMLTEEIKDLKAEIHRKDQWIKKMHEVSKTWVDRLQTEEMKKESKDSLTALENISANPNYRKK